MANDMLREDILFAVKGESNVGYSKLHRMLSYYPREALFEEVRAMKEEGILDFSEGGGFFAPSAWEADDVEDEGGGEPEERETESDGETGSSGELVIEPADTAPAVEPESPAASEPAAPSEEPAFIVPQGLEGMVLNSTRLARLGLPDHIADMLEQTYGINDVGGLVASLHKMDARQENGALPDPVDLAWLLVQLAGSTSVPLDKEQSARLHHLASSALFFFDWLGRLCSDMPKASTREDVARRIGEDGLAYTGPALSMKEFAKLFDYRADRVTHRIMSQLAQDRYPVNDEAFYTYMLPIVHDWLECGECETEEKAFSCGVELLAEYPETEAAIAGFLLNKADALGRGGGPGGETALQNVGDDPLFVSAAKRLSRIDRTIAYDPETNRLTFGG